MHYREVPTQRPIHCFERCSDTPRWATVGALMLLALATTTALVTPIGSDVYCTRDPQGRRSCQLQQHVAARSSVRVVSDVYVSGEPARAPRANIRVADEVAGGAVELSLTPDTLAMDGRAHRDGIDEPVYRGVWVQDSAAQRAAIDAFHRGDSPAVFLRARENAGPKGVIASFALTVIAMCVGLVGAAQRRRYRIRFDPNSELAWVSEGSIFRMNPERERLLDRGELRAVMGPTIKLVTGGAKPVTLFESVHAADHGLFASIAASVQRARGPIKTIARAAPAMVYATQALVVAALGFTLLGAITRHVFSMPSDSGTLALRATTRCAYGGVTLLPGGSMQWMLRAGLHRIVVRNDRGDEAEMRAHITPGASVTLTCSEATFTQARR